MFVLCQAKIFLGIEPFNLIVVLNSVIGVPDLQLREHRPRETKAFSHNLVVSNNKNNN